MTEELKPCPFCGVSMHIERTPYWRLLVGDHAQTCVFMGTRTTMLASASDDQHLARVVSDWNRRAPPSPAHVEDEREAYELACHERAKASGRVFETHYFKRSGHGWYLNPSAEAGWQAWQARAALSAPPAAGVPEGWRELAQQAADALQVFTGHDSGPNLRHRYGENWWEPLNQLRDKLRAMLAAAPTPPASVQQAADALRVRQKPFLHINPFVGDEIEGRRKASPGGLTWSREACGHWTFPLYTTPPASEQQRAVLMEELLTCVADWCDQQPKHDWYGRTAGDMVRAFMARHPTPPQENDR